MYILMKKSFLLIPLLFICFFQLAYSNDGGPLSITILNVTHASCNGINNGSAEVTGNNGSGGYTYSWSPSGGTNALATNLAPGNYTVTVTDLALNTATTTITIGENFPVQITLDSISDYFGNQVTCHGDNNGWIYTSATGGLVFDSTTYAYTGAQQIFVVPNGVTEVTIRTWGAQGGANWVNNVNYGGYAQGDLAVTAGDTLFVYVGNQPAGITGGYNGGGNGEGAGQAGGGASDVRYGGMGLNNRKIVGAGAGGAGYWSNLHVVGGVGGGLIGGDGYRSTTADPGGQGGTQTGSGTGTCISFNNAAMAGGFGYGGAPSSCGCEGYGGGGGWYGGAGSGNCRGGGGGSSYIDGVTNGYTIGGVNIGNGKVIIVYGEPEGLSYQWSQGDTTSDVHNLAAGDYVYTVTSLSGCTATDIFTITEPAAIDAHFSSTPVLCQGDANGTATSSPTGGVSPYSYLWDYNADTTAFTNNLEVGVYVLVITDTAGCTFTDSVSISEPAALGVNFSAIDISCFGATDGSIMANPTGGTLPYMYLWNYNADTTASLNNLNEGVYVLVITDTAGCTFTDSASISEPTVLGVNFNTSDITCFGASDGIITANPTGGTSPYMYLWNNADTTASINNLPTSLYILTVTDSAGCTYTDSVSLTEPLDLLLSATTISESSGNDGSINLTVANGFPLYSFLWSDGTTTEDLNGLMGGSYVVVVTDAHGCSDTLTVVVGSSLSISENQPGNLLVYPNPTTGLVYLQVDPVITGKYTLSAIDLGGRSVYQSIGTIQAQPIELQTEEWSPGTYFIRLNTAQGSFVRKVVVN
jgi:hypothetical protein